MHGFHLFLKQIYFEYTAKDHASIRDMFPILMDVTVLIQIKNRVRTSLVAQWLRIRLPMQGTQVRSLVREDPTCSGATKPVRRNY